MVFMANNGFTSVTLPDDLVERIDAYYNKIDKEFNSRTKILDKAISLLEKHI